MRLVAKLTFAVVCAMALILSIYVSTSLSRQRAQFAEEIERDHRAIAGALAEAIGAMWSQHGRGAALHLVTEVNERRSDLTIQWEESNDEAVTDIETRIREENDVRHLVTRVPVRSEGVMVGILRLDESMEDEERFIRGRVLRLFATTVAMLAVGGVLAMALGAKLVGAPVRLLVDKATRIGRGDFDGPLRLNQNDELRELADAMNSMAEQLAQARDDLRTESTARIAALEQLRHGERLMTVGKLGSGIAHELGTPLSVVSARASMIAEGEATGEEARAYARIIVEQSKRMTAIIRQLLDFARQRKPERVREHLGALAGHTVGLLEPLAEKRGVTLRVLERERIEADADRGQLEQALTNLLVNAIQAAPAGTEVVVSLETVVATAEGGEPGPYAAIAVRDHGPGIAEEDLQRVFEPFFTTKAVGEGTGLGLSVSYGIVREHGGWIDVQSKRGEGSCFTIHLPMATQ